MSVFSFAEYFAAVHGYEPFPWQRRLAEKVVADGRWPDALALPTAAGKTAVVDIAVYHLARQAGLGLAQRSAPLRVFFVVDRRVVVDAAFERAGRIATVLRQPDGPAVLGWMRESLLQFGGDSALLSVLLRGGLVRDESWTHSVVQPTVCVSTVDQIGSRLLFRAYGAGRSACNTLPIHAALVGNDALVIVDEAHLSAAFVDTLQAVRHFRDWADTPIQSPWHVVEMSATHPSDTAFQLKADDKRHRVLKARLDAKKPATLVSVSTKKIAKSMAPAERRAHATSNRELLVAQLVRSARELANQPHVKVVAVVVNRVKTARLVFHALRDNAEAVLLTGRGRPADRDALLEEWLPRVRAGRVRTAEAAKAFVVATQTIEVGADFDFDALVTECAPLDALRQRFGRLDRLGNLTNAPAHIVGYNAAIDGDPDAVYGDALIATWKWLKAMASVEGRGKLKRQVVDFGSVALDALRRRPHRDGLDCTPTRAPVLLPAHLDMWTQTSPIPAVDPNVAVFLHGPATGPGDVTLVWRADLDGRPIQEWVSSVALLPPAAAEAAQIPFVSARQWLARSSADDYSDLEGFAQATDPRDRHPRPVVRWLGRADATVVTSDLVRPGDVLVVPAGYGGLDRYGWDADAREPVVDIAEDAAFRQRGRAVLRFPSVNPDDFQADEALQRDADGTGARAQIAARLLTDSGYRVLEYPGERGVVVLGARRYGQDVVRGATSEEAVAAHADAASASSRVTLEAHSAGVVREVDALLDRLQLAADLRDALGRAALWHDAGKAEPRFQVMLHGGDALAAAMADEVLAKSGMDPLDTAAWESARASAGWPTGARHEALSVALLASTATPQAHAALVAHLIAAHHGAARPFFRPFVDDLDDVAEVTIAGERARSVVAHGLTRLDSGVADRFWSLVPTYGWYGLAFLEAVLRLADQRQSAREASHVQD